MTGGWRICVLLRPCESMFAAVLSARISSTSKRPKLPEGITTPWMSMSEAHQDNLLAFVRAAHRYILASRFLVPKQESCIKFLP